MCLFCLFTLCIIHYSVLFVKGFLKLFLFFHRRRCCFLYPFDNYNYSTLSENVKREFEIFKSYFFNNRARAKGIYLFIRGYRLARPHLTKNSFPIEKSFPHFLIQSHTVGKNFTFNLYIFKSCMRFNKAIVTA